MKYLKRFNEELSPETLKSAEDKLRHNQPSEIGKTIKCIDNISFEGYIKNNQEAVIKKVNKHGEWYVKIKGKEGIWDTGFWIGTQSQHNFEIL